MWEDALKVYTDEEQVLRATIEKATASEIDSKTLEKRKIISEWESIIFGPRVVPNEMYWALTCAEKDLGTFIALRYTIC